jgi:hypothetical protein
MARTKKGILGDQIAGSLSTLVFSSRNGIPYIRTKPANYRDAKTPKQLANRMRLGLLSGLLKTFKPVIQIGFNNPPLGKSSRDIAYSTNSKEVIKGSYPDMYIDYSAFVISIGNGSPISEVEANLIKNEIHISWNASAKLSEAGSPNDRLMAVTFNSTNNTLNMNQFVGKRVDAQAIIALTNSELKKHTTQTPALHLWLSFISPDGQTLSESRYIDVSE